ncbi:MAG: glycosyltransferase [Methylophilaceae bacterium]
MPKVLVVGKINRLVNWTENTVEAFQQTGCQVDYFAINGDNRLHSMYFKWRGVIAGDDFAAVTISLRKKVKAFQPDLIVFVLGAWLPAALFQAVEEISPASTKVAWVGDKFDHVQGVFAGYMDWIFCTDTYFMDLLRTQGISTISYLPLAVDPQRFYPMNKPRTNKIIYVAKNSPGRSLFLSKVEKPLLLYGKKWRKFRQEFPDSPHEIHAHHLPLNKLPSLYASSRAVLNIKHEIYVERGVNQRSFEPYGCMTPVLNDDVADLGLCFDLGREILVYHSLDELHEIHAKLTSDPAFAKKIGLAGHQRVMAQHTYMHRARSILKQVGLE